MDSVKSKVATGLAPLLAGCGAGKLAVLHGTFLV